MRKAMVLTLCMAACTAPVAEDTSTAWRVVQEGESLGGAVLAAWGWDADNLIFVGGSLGNGLESLVYHWNGEQLKALRPGGTETFWWIHGTGPNDMWMVGEHGRITHFDGSTFEDQPRVVDTTLWGAMAFAPDDVWVVGGMPGRPTGAPNDVVLHFNGTEWTQETLPGTPRDVALLKVWGSSAEDLYVVGEEGVIWHRGNDGWTLQSAEQSPPLASGTLFTVHGCGPDDVWAAGGTSLLHNDGNGWALVEEAALGQANGVSCKDGKVAVVGFSGLKVRREDGTSHNETRSAPFMNLHAVFTAADGALWAVGGDWVSAARQGAAREGCIARYGPGTVKAELVR